MLEPVKHIIGTFHIILASSSPRRCELLKNLGLNFEVVPSTFKEDLDPKSFPNHGDFAAETAYQKVLEVSERVLRNKTIAKPFLIIGADTVVSLDGKLYGKPKDNEMAYKFLNELSGQVHTVYTGVALKSGNYEEKFYTSTEVTMGKLDPEVIQAYVNSGEPMDKAGAYGIQGKGSSLVKKINGDYFNVMGLPVHETCRHLVTLLNQMKEHTIISQ